MKKTLSIILGIIILIVVLINLPNIIAHTKLYSFNHNKNVVTETKTVNADELFKMEMQELKLRKKLEDVTKYSLIAKEILKGEDDLNDDYEVVVDNPQIKLKIAFPITTFKDNDMTIKFISGKGKILKTFENGQWGDFNGTWDDLYKKLN